MWVPKKVVSRVVPRRQWCVSIDRDIQRETNEGKWETLRQDTATYTRAS